MADLATIQRIQHTLGLTEQGMLRVAQRLSQRPLPLSELADIGWRAPLGQQFSSLVPDYTTPTGYCNVRALIGTGLLIDTMFLCGVPRERPGSVSRFLSLSPIFRHLREDLAMGWINAAPVAPWPEMRAPFPAFFLWLPVGAANGKDPEEADADYVAALGVKCRETANGLQLFWSAWGWNGLVIHSKGLETKPDPTAACSKLAWGAVALMQQEPLELLAGGGTPRGPIRKKKERPAPSWLQPPFRYVRAGGSTTSTTREGPSPAPHWRAAHPHRFWTGPKGNQKLVAHWLPAIWVDPPLQGDSNDAPTGGRISG